jgi:5'-nucleotidase
MPMRANLWRAIILAAVLALPATRAAAQTNEQLIQQLESAAEVSWHAATLASDPVFVRLIGVNDLHGALLPQAIEYAGKTRVIGGVGELSAYIRAARAAEPKHALVLLAGDSIGASQLASGLLRDEPTLAVLNEIADGDCPLLTRQWPQLTSPVTTRCRIVATVGNHEFDHGAAELERLLYGGKHPDGPVLGHDWAGMHVPYLVANVVRREGGTPFLPGSAIVDLDGVPIGVIGAVTATTPGLVVAGRVRDLEFLPEAAAINAQVGKLRLRGVRTIVLVIHEGLVTPTAPQWVAPLTTEETTGGLAAVLRELDGGIDVVIAGHTHKLNNLLVRLKDGTLTLVTQARSDGEAISVTELTIDRATGATVAKTARVAPVWADSGASPDKKVTRIVTEATKATLALAARPIGVAAQPMLRAESPSGESALGDFVADADRAAAATELAFVNSGGVRSDVPAGLITFGSVYAVRPFGNVVMRFTLTGAQVLRLLEQQWSGEHEAVPRFLRPSGLRYVFDLRRAPGHRIVNAWDGEGQPLDPARRYSVAANDFLVGGGDFYPVLREPTDATEVVTDVAALEAFIRRAPGPVHAALDGRMERLDASTP